jgi:hypothetical protein
MTTSRDFTQGPSVCLCVYLTSPPLVDRLHELITSDHVTSLHLIDEIQLLVRDHIRTTRPTILLSSSTASTPPPLSPADQTLLSQTITQHLKATSPILLLYQKRIYKLLIISFLSSVPLPPNSTSSSLSPSPLSPPPSPSPALPHDELMRLLSSYSLHSKLQLVEVKEILKRARLVFEHQLLVFGPLYSTILRARTGSAPSRS